MPKYGMPGVAVDKHRSRFVGLVAIAVIAAVVAGYALYRELRTEDGLHIALHTEQIGDGVLAGTPVRVDGVQVGTVTDIEPDERGTQRISLRLDRSQLHGIDNSLQVDYAPANLFGISEIELRRGAGGSALRDDSVIDLTGSRADAIFDATMGSMLRTLSQTGDSVLTPQMATVISQVSHDMKAFTPLAQSIIEVAQIVTDNQRMPPSELAARLGPAFYGAGNFAGANEVMVDMIRNIPRLQNNRESFDAGVRMHTEKLLPGIANLGAVLGQDLSGTTDMLVPVLRLLAQMVPTPRQSGADLTEFLRRLRAAMPDTPNGPVLNAEIDLSGMPVLAPLLGGAR
ncbi:MlaD family protein [Nocardia pseudobrasiliensis]|uniref:ABC-type transporter Mla subunit MlaD n=1 Tax=Nocardia pseudobrasiliensis TaxID=45979 RepID=A0A370HWR3_9NOCA|nr:MlaD family protein [Nocardia pseudobrasiliensis]RDI62929.1 ABC-type transporter Mla subunit MlaD [Nocardia pseudobrasiliensis]